MNLYRKGKLAARRARKAMDLLPDTSMIPST